MPAPQNAADQQSRSLIPEISRIAIIAGGGSLPEKVVRACEEKGIEVFVVAFDGQTDPTFYEPRMHMIGSLSKTGKIVKALKEKGISDLIFIGSMTRPKFSAMIPDAYTARFIGKVGLKTMLGDDGLLKAVRAQLEEDGFTFHGAQDVLDGLFIPPGVLGAHIPSAQDLEDIRFGYEQSQAHGRADLGQSVIVQNGQTLDREDSKGTNALINRCFSDMPGGILVKTCKPQQDRQLDVPTIGPDTVRAAIEANLRGIAVQAGAVFVVDQDEVIALGDEAGVFIYGI